MSTLSIDIETYSSVDLTKSGVYAYVNAPDFQILLLAYAFDDEQVEIIEFPEYKELPERLKTALTDKDITKTVLKDEDITKTAFNANFERTCLSKAFGISMPPKQWRCTMVHGLELGLPGSLAKVAEVFGDELKDARGKSLITYFCKPCKPTKTNGGRTRNLPEHDPEKWETFKEYCIQDVVTERAIKKHLSRFPMDENEQYLWQLDQRINDRGVCVDMDFINAVLQIDEIHTANLLDRAKAITGLENPKSITQLKAWVEDEIGEEIDSLTKDNVSKLISECDNDTVVEALKIRQELAKTSVSKYQAMARSVCPDGRIRGLLQFYGANRTGRFAGRLVQVQNLVQNHLSDIYTARDTVKTGDYEYVNMMYDNISSLLSQLIRTALVPDRGKRFIVCDFSAIEARVIAYLANEKWRMDVFNSHGKIYEASAAAMFNVPVDSIKKGDPLRQKGKIAELALGYGGSVGALTSMGALKMGLQEEELKPLVDAWRAANPAITYFWQLTEKAVISAIRDTPCKTTNGISFYKEHGILFIGLPSGRRLAYVKPEIGVNKFGSPCVTYMGMNQTTAKWERIDTFGGKLVENIVQAFSRDCLTTAIARLEEAGYTVNFHVHDEVVIEVPEGESSVKEIANIMCKEIPWAVGLPLRADGYECGFYMKS